MPRHQPEVPVIKTAKNYLTINKIALTGDWGLGTGDWGHWRGEAVRPHAIRQTVMDRANAQINRPEAAEGALHRGQGFVVEHTVGADQVADGSRHRSGYRENRAARKPP